MFEKRSIYKNSKGITLIALVLTIVISLLLIVGVSASFEQVSELNKYYKIKEDIIALTKATQSYYLKTGELPLVSRFPDPDGQFNFDIKNYENGLDRNPNDNDHYFVLYSPEHPESVKQCLPEVNIRSTNSTYLINEKSLTVYSKDPFELDGKLHYTASEDFSGGKFASEYYRDLGIMDARMNISIDTGTVININGQNIPYSTYAHNNSVITLKVNIENEKFYDEEGQEKSNVVFENFNKSPNVNSFRIKITALDNPNEIYLDNASATKCTTNGKSCVFEFDLSKYVLNNMKNRRKITFSYDINNEFYFDEANRIDYDQMMKNYFTLNRYIEFENNTEEIIIASEMNKVSSSRDDFVKNIKTISNWNHYNTYADIITASSGQKYIITNDCTDFQKVYTLNLQFTANPTDVKFNGGKVHFNVNGGVYDATGANYSIDAVPGAKINADIDLNGFEYGTDGKYKYTMGTTGDEVALTVNATQYTFTLNSNLSADTFTLNNKTHNTFTKNVNDNKTTGSIQAYMGDKIEYNVEKAYYRYGDVSGTDKNSVQSYDIIASDQPQGKEIILNENLKEELILSKDANSGNVVKSSGS